MKPILHRNPWPAATERPRVLQLVTDPISANLFMQGQLSYLREQGFEVAVAASPGDALRQVQQREGVATFAIPMQREISPLADLTALGRLIQRIRHFRPHIVNAGTPKAGLLGMLAARAAAVPVRVYTLRGLRMETARGGRRRLLSTTERLACRCADTVVCVSPSLRQRAAELGLADPRKMRVLADGSSNGVHCNRFARTAAQLAAAAALADKWRLPGPGDPHGRANTVGFVGRLTADKGVVELAQAFGHLKQKWPEARLLLVGGFESGDAVPADLRRRLMADPAVTITGFVADPAPYYHLMGQLVLPSHREGFPNVALEAAAAELPVVAFDATGSRDAVVDGVTGRLAPLGDAEALASCIAAYIASPALRRQHGRAGRNRAASDFAPQRIWHALATLYRERLAASVPGLTAVPERDRRRAA